MTNNDSKVHVFEAAGLGKAPYRFTGVETKVGPIDMGNGVTCGAPGQPMGCCQYCSTGILYCFWLESADGKKFYVGSDCILKSGDAGLKRLIEPIVKEHARKLAEDRDKRVIYQFEEYLKVNPWSSNTEPHPYPWYAQQGKTMGDYQQFVYEHSGRSGKAKMARAILKSKGLIAPRAKAAPKDKKSGKVTFRSIAG